MANVNMIHGFLTKLYPDYQKKDVVEICRFFITENAIQKNGDFIKTTLNNYKQFEIFFKKQWEGFTGKGFPKRHEAVLEIEDEELKMPFGKYRHQLVSSLPLTYLEWMIRDNAASGKLLEAVKKAIADYSNTSK